MRSVWVFAVLCCLFAPLRGFGETTPIQQDQRAARVQFFDPAEESYLAGSTIEATPPATMLIEMMCKVAQYLREKGSKFHQRLTTHCHPCATAGFDSPVGGCFVCHDDCVAAGKPYHNVCVCGSSIIKCDEWDVDDNGTVDPVEIPMQLWGACKMDTGFGEWDFGPTDKEPDMSFCALRGEVPLCASFRCSGFLNNAITICKCVKPKVYEH